MSTWKKYATDEVYQRVNAGEREHEVIEDIVRKYEKQIITQAKIDTGKAFQKLMLERALELPDFMPQLSFDFGDDTFIVNDRPVVRPKPGGGIETIAAMMSTAEDRQTGYSITIKHFTKLIRRTENLMADDRRQSARMLEVGLDPELPWSVIQHLKNGTTCARCGGLPTKEDPFELGHFDAPASQGGRVLKWEHRHCNRSERANHVAPPVADDDRS